MVKVAKPQQDMRYDVPTVGLKTVENIASSGGRVLAIEADRTILLDGPEVIDFADRHGLVIVAVRELTRPPAATKIGRLRVVLFPRRSGRSTMKSVRAVASVLGVLFLLQSVSSPAADWPMYRGPNQDGISLEKVDLQWSGDGPKVVWQRPINRGFSSFAASGGKVFTQVVRQIEGNPREICLALDAATGKELWFADIAAGEYPGGGDTAGGGDGPRSTPTVYGGKVYVFTPDLVARCLDEETGRLIWKRDLMNQHQGRNIQWKSAASVAVDGDLVFVAGGGPGESLLGLNKDTGAVVWKTGDERITHSTPVVATIHDQRQVIFFLKSGLVSVDCEERQVPLEVSLPLQCLHGDLARRLRRRGLPVGRLRCRQRGLPHRRSRAAVSLQPNSGSATATSPSSATGARPSARTDISTACSASNSSRRGR